MFYKLFSVVFLGVMGYPYLQLSEDDVVHSRKAKHPVIAAEICRWIDAQQLSAGYKLPTELELARRFKVSPVTIHRAMSGLAANGRVVRRRGSGTFVAKASHLSSPEHRASDAHIGLLWSDSIPSGALDKSINGRILAGVLKALGWPSEPAELGEDAYGATRAIWSSPSRGGRLTVLGEPRAEMHQHPPLESVMRERLDGLITSGIWDEPWLRVLLSIGIPAVVVDFPNETLLDLADHVYIDPRRGFGNAARHFFEKGCRRIHFIGQLLGPRIQARPDDLKKIRHLRRDGATKNPDSILRLESARGALCAFDLDIPAERTHFVLGEEEGALVENICANAPDAPDAPDAVICHGVTLADQIAKQSARLGRPILAAGATSGGEEYAGPAYLIDVDLGEVGRTAASLLSTRIACPDRMPFEIGVPMCFGSRARKLERYREASMPAK